MVEGIISTVVTTVVENSVNAVGRQFGYLWNYRKNMDDLEMQVNALESKVIDMDRTVNVAIRNAEEIGDQVEKWLSEARDISAQARSFLKEHKEKGKMRCVVGLCPNLVSRYQFGRRACKKEIDVAHVITKEGQIKKVSIRLVGMERTILSTEGFFTFDSRKSILEDIMKALQAETKNLVGLYGFGGMGKTTLAKQVASHAKEMKLFEEIVFASVTQKVDMKEIQGQLASMLDLKLDESTVAERAGRIHPRLKGKNVLVILDDLWKELDLKEVGVPFGAEHMGCKILLTSRFRHVLTSMGAEKDFSLGALEEEEAWRLFEKKAGNVLENSVLHTVGKKVAKRCQGLPVLIVTVASSLSKRPQLPAWKDALSQLKNMNSREMHDIVNSAIESISYNHLGKTHKRLFLLCGLIRGVTYIEKLLQYSFGWDLFDKEAVTIQEARDRLHTLTIDLKESCLLLGDVDSRNPVKMHDIVRDVAISIGRKDLNMFSMGEHDAELDIWPKDDDLKMCTAMVLRGCPNLPCLPQVLECPSLELFLINGLYRESFPSIPKTFFEKTNKLEVLEMSQLSISALPPSLSFLKNLQTLRVNNCDSLRDVSVVGELTKLQTLTFAGSGIVELPSGIGQLRELRSLDVRRCFRLEVIPAGLLARLTRLEELYLSQDFYRWEAEECVNGSVKTNASLLELKHLHNLCSLEILVGDDKPLPEDLHFGKLERYEIIVGEMWKWYIWLLDGMEVTRKICLQLSSTSINHLQHGVKMLFKSTECLWLGELKGFKNVTPALDVDGFPNLKHLRIQNDYEIQYIVNVVGDKQRKPSFPSLESMNLINLVKLQKIYNGPLMEGSFCNLTTLKVECCNGLKSLFSFSMAIALPRLQEIKVAYCDALEAIVDINDGVGEEMEFAHLRKLSLICLPNLKNFFSNGEKDELRSSLPFFGKVSFPKLQQLELTEISNLTEIWSHKFQETSCCNLTRLTIRQCKSLKHVFSSLVDPSLNKLEYLRVEDCEIMKTIIGDEDREKEEIIKATDQHEHAAVAFMFTELTEVCLQRLPKVDCLYSREHTIQCPALRDVNVADCGKLNAFDFLSIPEKQGDILFEKVMSKLENLSIRSIDLMKILRLYGHFPPHLFSSLKALDIVEFQGGSHVFPLEFQVTYSTNDGILLPQLTNLNLKKLHELKYICKNDQYLPLIFEILDRLVFMTVQECPRLTNFVPPSVSFRSLEYLTVKNCGGLTNFIQPSTATSLEKLRTLRISGCEMMEKIIGEDDEESSRDDNEIVFPSLQCLELDKLPRLTNFCSSPNYAFNFPELSVVTVAECTNMKTFCGGITTTPELKKVNCEGGEKRWEGDLNTTVQQIFAEMEAKKLTTTLPSTSSSNHVEANAHARENLSEELTEPIPMLVQIRQNVTNPEREPEVSENSSESGKGTETCLEVIEEGKGGSICVKVTANEKGKGKEVEVSETTRHSDPSTRIYTNREQIGAGSVASSSKPSSHSEEFPRLTTSLPSTSLNSQFGSEAEIHEKTGEEPPKVADTREKGKGKEIVVFGEAVVQHVVASSKLGLGTEVGAIAIAPSDFRQKDYKGSCVTRGSIPLGEFVQILQTQPVNNVSAEQVEFLEDAIGLFCTYVDKAKECLERKNAISELKRQMQALEDENEATASIAPRFG